MSETSSSVSEDTRSAVIAVLRFSGNFRFYHTNQQQLAVRRSVSRVETGTTGLKSQSRVCLYMTEDTLAALLEGNHDHVESRPRGFFDDVQEGQSPAVVSICCSDSRVSQEGMFSVEDPGWLFTPSNIGNQAWDDADGERVVNGNLLYPVEYTGTKTIVVVGHTGCGAVTAAYQSATGDGGGHPDGIQKWVETLEPVVAEGLDEIDTDTDEATVVNRLVEYNVDRQVAFLRGSDDIPDDVSVYGFVYDLHGAYGGSRGRTYFVNDDGETDPDAIRAGIADEYDEYATRLTE